MRIWNCLFVVGAITACGTFEVVAGSETIKTKLAVGLTLTDGNSDTMQANSSIEIQGQKAGYGSVRAVAAANYGTSEVDGEDETTVENAKASIDVKRNISDRFFALVNTSVLYDDIALIDYRATLGPGLGVYLVKRAATELSVELGVAYVWEETDNVKDSYPAMRAASRFEHKLSDTARVWQSAEYLPQTEDFSDYLVNAELGVEAALNSHMNLRVVLQDKYDSTPAEDLERNDINLIAGVSANL